MIRSLLLFPLMTAFWVTAPFAAVHYDEAIPQIAFAAEKVSQALAGTATEVVFMVESDALNPEAFTIRRNPEGTLLIVGTDPAGAMYGGLEVAEQIRIAGADSIQAETQKPTMGMRGIKFNIPLDVRTPTYTEMGDAAQLNMEPMWDLNFWKAFIDEMAGHRYNYLSLWNLHPFPSLVKVPDYPEVALDDVKRAVGLERKHYDGRGQDFDLPEILDDTETLLEMSIDQKIQFWREVMRYGKSRNVDLYFVTWNVFDYGTEGKYGIDDSLKNPVTVDYFRKSVKQLFLTYPDLKGIGITTGENMHDASNQEKEDWMLKTYGQGVLDVFQDQPNRKITFLHRQHQAGAGAIADTFRPLIDHPNVDFIFSYKYAKAHAYSSTRQPFYKDFAEEIQGRSDALKTIWTMRNDSTYLFRWAAPDFMREFVQNIPMELTRGYYFGSDGWVWGYEFVRREATAPRQLELQKHWMQWLLWGRLAYNPRLSTERITAMIQAHFPQTDGAKLLDAWQSASMVYPLTTGFHWGPLDYHWYPEACIGFPNFARTETGFHDVNRFITLRAHPGTGYTSIPEYVEIIQSKGSFSGTGPKEISAQLIENGTRALDAIRGMEANPGSELAETLADIESMALLSQYYGHKINGATHLHWFRETGDRSHQAKSVNSLKRAAESWKAYADSVLARYKNRIWMARIRTGPVDFVQITDWVNHDVAIAQNDPGTQ